MAHMCLTRARAPEVANWLFGGRVGERRREGAAECPLAAGAIRIWRTGGGRCRRL